MYKSQILKKFLKDKRVTLLNIGPMSKNLVDVSIEISDKFDLPLTLIASRRQIDSKEFSGGYVNNWDTLTFSRYVKKRSKRKKIFLARDHGGPWQNNLEINNKYNLKSAMESAKRSFKSDIDAGFDFLHLDTSIDPSSKRIKNSELFDRLFDLYEYCYSYSRSKKKYIDFEVGTEEQSGSTNTPYELDYNLKKINNFCKNNKITKPTYVVVQAGTKVMEMQNVGSFESFIRPKNETPVEIQLPKMIKICEKNDMMMKEHNTDYLTNESLSWHPKIGIHAANVAPEFGVIETKAIITLMKKLKLNRLVNEFLEISYNSLKWEKWMLKNSKATKVEKSIISGHYIFSKPEVKVILNKLNLECNKKLMINSNRFIKDEIRKSILRYLTNFNMLRLK